MAEIPEIGQQLRAARKCKFPNDDMLTFAMRLGVSRATLQKMEAGALSVSMASYVKAASLLNLDDGFKKLFLLETALFES